MNFVKCYCIIYLANTTFYTLIESFIAYNEILISITFYYYIANLSVKGSTDMKNTDKNLIGSLFLNNCLNKLKNKSY